MGRGTIAGGGAEGLYSVTLDYGTAARTARVAAMDAQVEELNTRIAAAADRLTLAAARTADALATVNSLVDQLLTAQLAEDSEAVTQLKRDVEQATAVYAQAEAAEAAVRVPRDMMIAERNLLVADRGRLQAALVQETRSAWCVDLTEDAAGVVATIEIPGEDQSVLIAPGGRAPTGADGQLMARELMSPEQVFFNAAILPGWQKWMPTYRKGTITWLDKDANLANVDLDASTSSANRLGVNQTPQLNGIPVDYMGCHAQAFEVGDRVVVQFAGMNWEAPSVIGFVEHPKPCSWICLGSFNSTGITLECLTPGLIDQLRAGATVTAWLNGAGPFDIPAWEVMGSYWHRLVIPLGSGVPDLYMEVVFWPGTTTSFPPEPVMPFGQVLLSVTPPWPPPMDGGRNIVEVIARVGGEKKLHVAFTDSGWSTTPTYQTAEIKGVPIRLDANSDMPVTLLDYTFVGS